MRKQYTEKSLLEILLDRGWRHNTLIHFIMFPFKIDSVRLMLSSCQSYLLISYAGNLAAKAVLRYQWKHVSLTVPRFRIMFNVLTDRYK